MNLTLKQIAEWTNGTLDPKFEEIEVSGISTDSRIVKSGQLFVPLAGDNFDGHDYISTAMQFCAATLSARKLSAEIPVIYVEDTLKAYGNIAKGYREMVNPKVIGITGSVGKTTTKEMVSSVMAEKFNTAKTEGNFNNHVGLPKTILSAELDAEVMVLEMGMNHFGEMSYLTSIAKPDMAIITNIGTSHIEFLGSREGILKAKLEITEGLKEDGVLILNGDEPMLWALKGTLPYRTIYFGIENYKCDLVAKNIQYYNDGVGFYVNGLQEDFEVYVPAPGRHTVYNALAAVVAGLVSEVEPSGIQEALSNFENAGMRQKIYDVNGMTIIEDCYNAGPESMEAALAVLGQRACTGRRIAVLGDMLELGNSSMAEHYKVGRLAAIHADMLFAFGNHAQRMVVGAVTGGMPAKRITHCESHEQMAKLVRSIARNGDVLLFKGSRGMKMEYVLKLVLDTEQNS